MPPAARATFYELQARNRRKTVLLLAVFVALFAVVGFGFDCYFFGFDPERLFHGEFPMPILTTFAMVTAGVMSLQSYYLGASQVLGATSARPADPRRPDEKQLINVVEELTIAAGLPAPPPVYVVPDPDPNAFAVGRDPRHAAVAVTEGLLQKLDREELQGVIAHELGHVRNLDIRTMTVVAALYGGLVLLSDWAVRVMRFGGGSSRSRGGRDSGRGGGGAAGAVLILVWLLLVVLAPLLGRLMALAVSRSREYDADATGSELTRNPLGLASALRKIDASIEPTRSVGRGAAHLCIADPMGRQVNERETMWGDFWGTHPPIRKRIAILESMAGVMSAPAEPGDPTLGAGGGMRAAGVHFGHA